MCFPNFMLCKCDFSSRSQPKYQLASPRCRAERYFQWGAISAAGLLQYKWSLPCRGRKECQHRILPVFGQYGAPEVCLPADADMSFSLNEHSVEWTHHYQFSPDTKTKVIFSICFAKEMPLSFDMAKSMTSMTNYLIHFLHCWHCAFLQRFWCFQAIFSQLDWGEDDVLFADHQKGGVCEHWEPVLSARATPKSILAPPDEHLDSKAVRERPQ